MKAISRVFRYVYHYLRAETKALRTEAFEAAKSYYAVRPLRTAAHPYPRVAEYTHRREAFQAYQRGYINQRCHESAVAKLSTTNK